MQTYVGYGFHVNDITNEELLLFIEKFNYYTFQHLTNEILEKNVNKIEDLSEEELETIYGNLIDYLENFYTDKADYISSAINAHQIETGKMIKNNLTTCYDSFVVFDSITFLEDAQERCNVIKSRNDFIELIQNYFPNADIEFGCLYEGSDWLDPNYYLE